MNTKSIDRIEMPDRSDGNSSQQRPELATSQDHDQHIRSATSLGRLLWKSGDIIPEPGENLEEQTDPTVAKLSNLAQCLTRLARENVAVGLLTDDPKITVSSSSPEGPSSAPIDAEDNQHDAETDRRGFITSNSPNANPHSPPPEASNSSGPQASNSSDPKASISSDPKASISSDPARHWDGIAHQKEFTKMIYRYYRYYKPVKAGKDSIMVKDNAFRGFRPKFTLYAHMVLRLFKAVLEQTEEEKMDAAIYAFRWFVIGMSLVRLDYKLKDPSWPSRTSNDQRMGAFVTSKPQLMDVSTNITLTERECLQLKKYAEVEKVDITPEARRDLESHTLTKDVMSLLHQVLGKCIKVIMEHSPNLQNSEDYPPDSSPSEEAIRKFTRELVKTIKALQVVHACLQNLKGILQPYISAIKTNPITSGNPTKDYTYSKDDDENEIDATSWRDAYLGWLQGIARQARAAGNLTSLSSSDKRRFAKIDFEILEESQPSSSMEPWEKTVDRIFVDPSDGETRTKVKKALSVIASSASHEGGDDDYKALDQWSFGGAIHCEAIIAIHSIKKEALRRYHAKFGVTKHCCVACSALLHAILGSVPQGGGMGYSTFLGSSKKIWPCALPLDCPVDVAEKVTKVIDDHMRDMLKESLPRLQFRAQKYSSGGSADERSGQQDDQLDKQIELLDIAVHENEEKLPVLET